MKRMKLGGLMLLAAFAIVAVGSAALSAVSFERTISAGQILVDTDENVAVQITNTSDYAGLVKTEEDGKASIHLNEAISGTGKAGFNTDAIFSIGSPTDGVIRIKNNSDVVVNVAMENEDGGNAITMSPVNGSGSTIAVGAAVDYYFTVNTHGQDALKTLNATLKVEGQK
jgi:hypothetical protein